MRTMPEPGNVGPFTLPESHPSTGRPPLEALGCLPLILPRTKGLSSRRFLRALPASGKVGRLARGAVATWDPRLAADALKYMSLCDYLPKGFGFQKTDEPKTGKNRLHFDVTSRHPTLTPSSSEWRRWAGAGWNSTTTGVFW